MIENNKLIYLAITNKQNFAGIYSKISDTMVGARDIGYRAHLYLVEEQSLKGMFFLFNFMIKSTANTFIIRSINPYTFVFIPFYLIARLQGKTLIYDNVTPMISTFIDANFHDKTSIFKKTKNTILFLANGSWSYLFFNKIIQYGNESWYFNIFNYKRTILIGNGIDKNRINQREKKYTWPNNQLRLLTVATIVEYQGIDRMIMAISKWNKDNHPYNIRFDVIGDGPNLDFLKKLVLKNNLEDYIIFHGRRDQKYISEYYALSHLAVSALSLYKVKLTIASALKAREYCLCGIPFIATGADPDFSEKQTFRFEVANDNGIEDILKIFSKYPGVYHLLDDSKIRKYAIDNLSFSSKLKKIGL